MYCGDKLPKWYIGSSYEEKILKGYNGTVCSLEYKSTYINEQKNNKHLFKTRILSYHNDSTSAREEELRLQKMHSVVKNKNYINKALAQPNGCHGMEKSVADRLATSERSLNKVSCIDKISSTNLCVTKDEFDNNDNLVGVRYGIKFNFDNAGFVSAKDLTTHKNIKVSKEEFYSNDNLIGSTTGSGGEHLKGTISVRNKENETIRINKSDFDTTIHRHFRSNTIAVRDVNNNIILVSLDDERYLSGELVHINKGKSFGSTKKHMPQPIITCPHCGKFGGISNMKRWHFNNCKLFEAFEING